MNQIVTRWGDGLDNPEIYCNTTIRIKKLKFARDTK